MQPPKASTPSEIDFFCSDEELFLSLDKIQRGSPLPENVIAGVNPFQHTPSNLPDSVWFFVHSGHNSITEFGFWKIKGEACILFSNSLFTGWRTTFEYYERQAPHSLKTDWMMHEYWIIQKKVIGSSKTKEASSLFRVFLGGEVRQNHHMMQKMFSSNIVADEKQILCQQSVFPSEKITEAFGSSSNAQVSKNEGSAELTVERKFPDHQRRHIGSVDESDYLSAGDFLELHDLDIPPSPTSSSENSSCVTMSSNDSLDLLREIEDTINLDLVRRDASCKSSTSAPLRLNEVVIHPSSSVFSGKIEEEKALIPRIQNEKTLNRHGGRSVDSSSKSSASSSGESAADGEKKGRGKGMKKKLRNYICFIPF